MANQFIFKNHPLKAHHINDQIWFESAGIAKALGYANPRAVTGLYANYKNEFTEGMSLITESMINGINNSLRKIKTRIFSLPVPQWPRNSATVIDNPI